MIVEMKLTEKELKEKYNPEGSILRKQQMRMLQILLELDRICKKYNIPYFLYGGTLLGAIRHQGFIPWDDDLDVALYRKDYDKLMKILPNELSEKFALQTNDTDKNYFYFFAKIRDKKSYLEEFCGYDRFFKEKGIFIDIFPFEKQQMWTHLIAERLQGHCYKISRTSKNDKIAIKKIKAITAFNRYFSFPILKFISKITCGKRFTYSNGIPFHLEYKEEYIHPLTTHLFEGHLFPVPCNSHEILTMQYGNYMQLPDLDHLPPGHAAKLEIYES